VAALLLANDAYAGSQSQISNEAKEAITAVIQSLLTAVSAQDTNQLLSAYAPTADYMDRGTVNQDAIKADFMEYFSRWPTSRWALDSPIAFKPTTANRVQATFKMDFDVANEAENRRSTGQAAETLLFEFDSDMRHFRIVAHHEKILGRHLSSAASASGSQATALRAPSTTSKSHNVRPAASAAEAQRMLDSAEISGHVGELLQRKANEAQVGKEIRNDWPLSPELMSEWKHALIDTANSDSPYRAEFLKDEQLEKFRQTFNVPRNEEIYIYYPQYELGGIVTDDCGYEAVVTNKALYLHSFSEPKQSAPPVLKPTGSLERHAADPVGFFRISHSALLATDSFSYNARLEPYVDRHTEKNSWNCIAYFGNWMTAGQLVFDFGSEGPDDCGLDASGKLTPDSHLEDRHLVSFLSGILKYDIEFAIKAARQRHLKEPTGAESGTSTTSSDLLSGYLGVPWGASFNDTSRKLAAKGASQYSETHVSEAEWNRMANGNRGTIGQTLTSTLGGLPARPPFAAFTFADDMATKIFLFYEDRFYAVINDCKKEWIDVHGEDLLKVMCQKYGQPQLGIVRRGDIPLVATWENNSGIITASLKQLEQKYDSFTHHLRNFIGIEVDPDRRLNWGIEVEGAGPAGQYVKANTPITVKTSVSANDGGGGYETQPVSIYLEKEPSGPAKGKYFVVVMHIVCNDQANPLNAANVNDKLKHFLYTKTSLIGPPGIRVSPTAGFSQSKDIFHLDHQYSPGMSDFEEVLLFDVPVNALELSLVIDAPERIRDHVNAVANNKVEVQEHPPIFDLEQTDGLYGYAGQLSEKDRELFRISMAGKIVYASNGICKEIRDSNNADKSKQDQQRKDAEKKRQKELKEKF